MALDLNLVMLAGRLTSRPESKSLPSGIMITNFSVATNRKWVDKEGNKQEETQFHSIVVFGKQAESCAKYLDKGHSVLLEGRNSTRSWEDDNGIKHYRTEIVAERVQFGAKADGGDNQADADQSDPPF